MGVAELGRDEAFVLAEAEASDLRMHHPHIDRLAGGRLELLRPGARSLERRLPLVLEIERVDGDKAEGLGRLGDDRRNQVVSLLLHPAVDAVDDPAVAEIVDQHVRAGAGEAEHRKLLRPDRAVEGDEIGEHERAVPAALRDRVRRRSCARRRDRSPPCPAPRAGSRARDEWPNASWCRRRDRRGTGSPRGSRATRPRWCWRRRGRRRAGDLRDNGSTARRDAFALSADRRRRQRCRCRPSARPPARRC